jgi:hypothetical protein
MIDDTQEDGCLDHEEQLCYIIDCDIDWFSKYGIIVCLNIKINKKITYVDTAYRFKSNSFTVS